MLALYAAAALASVPTVEIAPGVQMPLISLGTCCGSDPGVGVAPWLQAGGTAIDGAYSYFNQGKIASGITAAGVAREDVFVTTKVPGTIVNSLSNLKTDLKQLGMSYVDLVLLHMPGTKAGNAKQWADLEQALAQNLTRSIGVSNYNQKQLAALLETATVKPAVNQCKMDIKDHDDATIAYCQQNGITYEAYNAMKGCDFSDATINKVAAAHNKSAAQVCLRYIVDRGCVMAVGTGSDASQVVEYSKDNLGIFDFKLSSDELAALGNL